MICSSQGEVVFNQKTRKKHLNFHYFWLKFLVAELEPKSVNFLSCCAASTYTVCFEVYLLITFSPPYKTLKSLPHKVHQAKPSLFAAFWMNLNLLHQESLNFIKYFCQNWESWHVWFSVHQLNASHCLCYHKIVSLSLPIKVQLHFHSSNLCVCWSLTATLMTGFVWWQPMFPYWEHLPDEDPCSASRNPFTLLVSISLLDKIHS